MVSEPRRLIRPGFVIAILLQCRVDGAEGKGGGRLRGPDLTAPASPVVLRPLARFLLGCNQDACTPDGPPMKSFCFEAGWFPRSAVRGAVHPRFRSAGVFGSASGATVGRGGRVMVAGSGEGLQGNISHKIPQQCLCKHVLAR